MVIGPLTELTFPTTVPFGPKGMFAPLMVVVWKKPSDGAETEEVKLAPASTQPLGLFVVAVQPPERLSVTLKYRS